MQSENKVEPQPKKSRFWKIIFGILVILETGVQMPGWYGDNSGTLTVEIYVWE
jgi:hypothetical protein